MSTQHVDEHPPRIESGRCSAAGVWATSWRLALVVSTVAGLLAAAFADRVAHSTLIVAVIIGASLVSWISVEQAPPARSGSRP